MQIELIDTFLDLIETRSFNRTAERLGVTQSTVSGRVAALEESIGARLFDRSRAGTTLTIEGRRFESHARNLRHEWRMAKRRIQLPLAGAELLRLGIQNDLAAQHIGDWVADFRKAFPDTTFYIEPDYSNQMCIDLLTGVQDFAVLYAPKPHPDLHFETLGDVAYVMVSSESPRLADQQPDRFVFAHFSPLFETMHREATPDLVSCPVSVGQSATVVSLLKVMGGGGYVLEKTAATLITEAGFLRVEDAPVLNQPVYAAMHLRHRTAKMHRQLVRIVGQRLAMQASD